MPTLTKVQVGVNNPGWTTVVEPHSGPHYGLFSFSLNKKLREKELQVFQHAIYSTETSNLESKGIIECSDFVDQEELPKVRLLVKQLRTSRAQLNNPSSWKPVGLKPSTANVCASYVNMLTVLDRFYPGVLEEGLESMCDPTLAERLDDYWKYSYREMQDRTREFSLMIEETGITGEGQHLPGIAAFPWKQEVPMETQEWALKPPLKIQHSKAEFFDILNSNLAPYLQDYHKPDRLNWLSRLKQTKVWDTHTHKKMWNIDLRAKDTRMDMTHEGNFFRMPVQKSACETRDAVGGDVPTMNTIWILDECFKQAVPHLPYDCMNCKNLEKRVHHFYKKNERLGRKFLMVDIKKCGLTFPPKLLAWLGEYLAKYYGDDVWTYLDIFLHSKYYDEEGFFLGESQRGYFLGMANRMASAIFALLYAEWNMDNSDGLFFNDDQVIALDDWVGEDSWTNYLTSWGILLNEKKTFCSADSLVFCEIYKGYHAKNREIPLALAAWSKWWQCPTVWHLQQLVAPYVLEAQEMSDEALDIMLSWYISTLKKFGTSIGEIDLRDVPCTFGGWSLRNIQDGEYTLKELQYMYRVNDTFTADPLSKRLIRLTRDMLGITSYKEHPFKPQTTSLKECVRQINVSRIHLKPGTKKWKKYVLDVSSTILQNRGKYPNLQKWLDGFIPIQPEGWLKLVEIPDVPLIPPEDHWDWTRWEIATGLIELDWPLDVDKPHGGLADKHVYSIDVEKYSNSVEYLKQWLPEKEAIDTIERYIFEWGVLPLFPDMPAVLHPVPVSYGRIRFYSTDQVFNLEGVIYQLWVATQESPLVENYVRRMEAAKPRTTEVLASDVWGWFPELEEDMSDYLEPEHIFDEVSQIDYQPEGDPKDVDAFLEELVFDVDEEQLIEDFEEIEVSWSESESEQMSWLDDSDEGSPSYGSEEEDYR